MRIHRSKSIELVRTLFGTTCNRRRQVLETQDTTEAISACYFFLFQDSFHDDSLAQLVR